jgi:hypothetical protein
LENFGKICFFSQLVSIYFLDKIRQMFHITKIEKHYCLQLKYYFVGLTQEEGEGANIRAGHSEPAPTRHHPLDAHSYSVLDDHYY